MRNLAYFDKEWVLNWLFNNAPRFYEVMATHMKRSDFENWIAEQIQNIGKFVAGFEIPK